MLSKTIKGIEKTRVSKFDNVFIIEINVSKKAFATKCKIEIDVWIRMDLQYDVKEIQRMIRKC